MNRRLEQLVKSVDIDPDKTKLFVFNNEQVTYEDALKVLEILKARGHRDATAIMVVGDVRTAVEAHQLPVKESE